MNLTFSSTNRRRWMLVDDNPDLLSMMSMVVKNFTSARVECHESAESALAAFATAPGSYELVITDFEMPGMDGVDLCRHLHSFAPAQKVFLATGSGILSPPAAQRAGFCALLNKPFPLVALQEALASAGLLEHTNCVV